MDTIVILAAATLGLTQVFLLVGGLSVAGSYILPFARPANKRAHLLDLWGAYHLGVVAILFYFAGADLVSKIKQINTPPYDWQVQATYMIMYVFLPLLVSLGISCLHLRLRKH